MKDKILIKIGKLSLSLKHLVIIGIFAMTWVFIIGALGLTFYLEKRSSTPGQNNSEDSEIPPSHMPEGVDPEDEGDEEEEEETDEEETVEEVLEENENVPAIDKTNVALSIKLLNIKFIPENIDPIYNPDTLTNELIQGMNKATKYKGAGEGALKYSVVQNVTVQRSTTKRSDERMDYAALLSEFDICSKLKKGEIDEVWIWVNAGDGAGLEYAISGPSISESWGGMPSCGQTLTVMGFDYTRPWDLALHSMGHRMEFVAEFIRRDDYDAFDTRLQRYGEDYDNHNVPLESGTTGCGNIHFPPNAQWHYDYSNTRTVKSDCADWKIDRSGKAENINCTKWGCSQEGFITWWMNNLPGLNNTLKSSDGSPATNWWLAFGDYDKYAILID